MTIEDILRLTIEKRQAQYQAKGIEQVEIDGNIFTNYKAFSFVWEKSYVKSPVRSGSGTIDNLDSYATFLTPHLKIDYSLLSIDDYRKIMTLAYSKNEHTVKCYDVLQNKETVQNMYFATEEMPKLHLMAECFKGEKFVSLIGVDDYTVELIGTNTNTKQYTVTYVLNPPSDVTWGGNTTAKETFTRNMSISMGKGAIVPTGVGDETIRISAIDFDKTYKFKYWFDNNNVRYIDGNEYYLKDDIKVYAEWEKIPQ